MNALLKGLEDSKKKYLIDKYGSREGYSKTYWHRLVYRLGRYDRYKKIDWNNINRLVFICKGNICRSAFAESVAKKIGIEAISCGIFAIEGAAANDDAIRTAQNMGYDLSQHLTTPVMYPVLTNKDLLVAMEPWQADLVSKNLARIHHTTLLGIWGDPITPYIYDPFLRSVNYFNNCFIYIEKTVYAIANKIQKRN